MTGPVEIYDTTLRDGSQRAGLSYSVADKLRIARALDALGVTFVEAGWPGSNPKDAELFARLRQAPLARATVCAFGATRRVDRACADDPSLVALLDAGTPVCTIFGKSSRFQAVDILGASAETNLQMIADTVAFLRAAGRRVIYDAEHFAAGFAADPAYALATLAAAARAGAETVVLCDTNGGALPWELDAAVRAARDHLGAAGPRLGVHAHDDSGCATASTLAAVRAGATHVQGTINGYGERCGNADLTAVVPGLALKLGVATTVELTALPAVARLVADIANLPPDDHAPYVGASAFAHKGGVHVAAMLRDPTSYQHVDPAAVGNATRFAVSELAGRATLIERARALGLPELSPAAAAAAVATVKAREAAGWAYEAADGSVALLVRRAAPGYAPPFAVDGYQAIVSHRGDVTAIEATVRLRIGAEHVHAAADGDGPVHALDRALRKALTPTHPALTTLALADYKVRVVDGDAGTRAITRVLIDWRHRDTRFATVGASPNILEATWHALVDGLELAITSSDTSPARRSSHARTDRPLSW